jgi:hypothetical protein
MERALFYMEPLYGQFYAKAALLTCFTEPSFAVVEVSWRAY